MLSRPADRAPLGLTRSAASELVWLSLTRRPSTGPCAISTSAICGPGGTRSLGDGRSPICHAISCLSLAYRLQADHFGDLDSESRRLLDSADYRAQAPAARTAG